MKRMSEILCILFLLLSFTACSGEKTEADKTESIPVPESPVSTQENVAEKEEGNKEDASKREEEDQESIEKEGKLSNRDLIHIMIADDYLSEWEELGNDIKMCQVSWQILDISQEERVLYPKLDEKLREKNEQQNQFHQEFMNEMLPYAKEHYEAAPDAFYPYFSNSNYSLVRGDKYLLSIREDMSEYTGGAHGMYGTWGMNLEPNTGEELLIQDVLTSTENLPSIIADKIIEKYADEYETFENLEATLEKYKPEDYKWVMGYEGISIFFNPYEIAAYYMGVLKVDIGFCEMPELFVEKYTKVPENGYIMEVPGNEEVILDLDLEDGKKDKLSVSTYYATEEDREYGIKRIEIALNGDRYREEECYGYDFTSYLACVKQAEEFKYYLYVEGVAENDYSTFLIFDLNHGVIQVQERIGGLGFSGYWDDSVGEYGTYYKFVPNDSQSFELVTRMEILGTWSGRKMYSIHPEDGTPKPSTDYYFLSHISDPIVSLIPLEVMMLAEKINEELPAGTSFYFLRTDGKSYMDARLEDGRECRIFVEFDGWEQSINGTDQWECFENLPYAG